MDPSPAACTLGSPLARCFDLQLDRAGLACEDRVGVKKAAEGRLEEVA